MAKHSDIGEWQKTSAGKQISTTVSRKLKLILCFIQTHGGMTDNNNNSNAKEEKL
jgi:hypothetical protein